MNVKLTLDRRRALKDGRCPVKISISHNSTSALLKTSVAVDPKQWDGFQVKSGGNKHSLNDELQQRLMAVRTVARDIIVNSEEGLTATQVKNECEVRLGNGWTMRDWTQRQYERERGVTFVEYYEKVARTKKGSTREKYDIALRKSRQYDATLDMLLITDINRSWVEGLDAHMKPLCPSGDTRSMYLRCIKHVMALAEDDDLITKSPFRKFAMPKSMPKHKDMTEDDLRRLVAHQAEPSQQKYKDYFLLSFMMRGINPADLLLAKWSDVKGGYLSYDRQKTGKEYKVKIEPEMMAIIKKYRGKKNLLSFCDGLSRNGSNDDEVRKKIHAFNTLANRHLKKIGVYKYEPKARHRMMQEALFPDLIMYSARHTWATIAYDICEDFQAVADGLGHSKVVTDRYVRRTQKKIDDVSRQVIDYIYEKTTPKDGQNGNQSKVM